MDPFRDVMRGSNFLVQGGSGIADFPLCRESSRSRFFTFAIFLSWDLYSINATTIRFAAGEEESASSTHPYRMPPLALGAPIYRKS